MTNPTQPFDVGAFWQLVSADAAREAGLNTTGLTRKVVDIRGRVEPLTVYVMPAIAAAAMTSIA